MRGTAAAPITVAHYPGERATIDIKGAAQGFIFTNSPNPSGAAYVNFKNFENTNSDTNRKPGMPVGIYVRLSDHLKFINLVVHDTGDGFVLTPDATNTEVYGCLVYYNGASDGKEHGIYIQNVSRATRKPSTTSSSTTPASESTPSHTRSTVPFSTPASSAILLSATARWDPQPHTRDMLLGGDAVAISPLIDGNATYKAAPG